MIVSNKFYEKQGHQGPAFLFLRGVISALYLKKNRPLKSADIVNISALWNAFEKL